MKLPFIASLLCFLWLLSGAAVHSAGSGEQIFVNKGPFGPYYHLRFDLRADAIDFAQSDRTARSGGQFEIRLRREMFPVPAPRCRGAIILRMPWTLPLTTDAKEKIAAKQELLQRILELEKRPDGVVSVIIELNPYVKVVTRKPLKLELTQCNVFFRDAHGAYVDNT